MNKRHIAAALAVLMLLTAALTGTACSGSKNSSTDSAQNAAATALTPQQSTDDPGYQYAGQQIDFKGDTFSILYPSQWSLYTNYYFAADQTGDAVNDALYKRTADANDYFNINIQAVDAKSIDQIAPYVKKEVMAGSTSIDIALTHSVSGLDTMVLGNLVYNWEKMPNVDYTKKYWNQSMNEYLNIDGYMPYVASDLIIPDPCFLTFSKDLIKQYGLDDPYQLVTSGQWTWDKLTEMAKQVTKDVDGDGKYTDADLYGFAGELDWQFINAMYSCDQKVMAKDADGRYVLDVNNQKTQDIVNKLSDLLYNGNQSFTWVYNAQNIGKPYIPFESGRVLFYMNQAVSNGIDSIKLLRADNFDFGIIPYPKYDADQTDYISLNWAGMICAPLDIANPEEVGAVTDYLGAESYSTVWPAYFDVLLNGKLSRDTQSQAMLDIIYGDSIYDFGLNFGAFNDLLYAVPKLLQTKSTDLASFYAKRATAIQAQYDKVYDAFTADAAAN